jgi:glyoxylase-like metal-dependent hydrolase (beta-lactamase superfamily II)
MTTLTTLPGATLTQDDVYHVWSVRFARLSRRIHENFIITDLHDGPMPLDYNFWILQNAHRTVLVDTGFGPRAAAERGRELDVDPITALARVGVDPASINDVILTHLHYDHAGNMDRLPAARFHVQESEVAFATGRCMCERFMRFPFDVEDVVTLVRHTFADRVRFHAGDAYPLPGISLHLLPGHTAGIQAVRVLTPRGVVLLASDVTHYYANFLRRSPFVLTVDAAATLRSYESLISIAGGYERVIPGHDPRIRDLYPLYDVGGVSLAALHEAPRPHALSDLTLG